MRYLIRLKGQNTGYETEIVAENNMPLAKFAELVRRETSLPYTDNVDEAKIAAKVEDGILTIELPKIKREEGKTTRQIAIS